MILAKLSRAPGLPRTLGQEEEEIKRDQEKKEHT